jgi:hypothetical protein
VHAVELQNSESRVAKLRDEGERLPLPYVLLQEVYKLEVSLNGGHSHSHGVKGLALVFHRRV